MFCLLLATHLSMTTITVTIIYNSNTGSGRHCQVYPSEYAYHKDSVTRSESDSANCRRYPSGLAIEQSSIFSENYIHCNGTQLRLSDSELGLADQYASTYYYEWSAGSEIRQLLFIFPTRVNLTTITLHYYSDSQRGLPLMRFYAVPDDFDVWDSIAVSGSYVEIASVQPGEVIPGLRNISIDVSFNIQKIVMIMASRTYHFSVSEVQFTSTCHHGKLQD